MEDNRNLSEPSHGLGVALHHILGYVSEISGLESGPHRCERNRSAVVDLHIHLVTRLEACEFEKRGVEDDPLGVADFGDGLDHG